MERLSLLYITDPPSSGGAGLSFDVFPSFPDGTYRQANQVVSGSPATLYRRGAFEKAGVRRFLEEMNAEASTDNRIVMQIYPR